MPRTYSSELVVKVGGAPLPKELTAALARVEVDTSLHLPGMFVIEIADQLDPLTMARKWLDHAPLAVGSEVEILAAENTAPEGGTAGSTPLIKGQITSIEADFPENAVGTVILRGYDKCHLLQRGTKTATFQNVTDGDLAKKVAGPAGLSVRADPTPVVHQHVFQNNLSDWDFLKQRAAVNGFVVSVVGDKLNFVKPATLRGTPVALTAGENLIEFRPRLTASQQPATVTSQGWDAKAKRSTASQAATPAWSPNKIGMGRGAAAASKAFGQSKLVIASPSVDTASSSQAAADSTLSAIASADVTGNGVTYGNAEIVAGGSVKVEGLGQRFSGEYTVTSVRHTATPSEGYRTEFRIGGMDSGTLAATLTADPRKPVAPAERGLVIGLVTNNKDPEAAMRVKVKYPWLSDDVESHWAPVVSPMAGAGRGLAILPEVGDEVVVGFLNGDFNFPFVLGSVWNGVDSPPSKADKYVVGGKVVLRELKTRAGHTILIDDTEGQSKIQIVDSKGQSVLIDGKGTGSVEITTKGDVSVSAGLNAKVEATSVAIEAKAKIELKAPMIDIAGSAKVKITGGFVEIN